MADARQRIVEATYACVARKGIASVLAPYVVDRGLVEGVDLGDAADFLARMVLSYISAPGRWDLDDPEQVARLVRSELLAGVVVPAGTR